MDFEHEEIHFFNSGSSSVLCILSWIGRCGKYGEVYIPDHEFVGFYDETGTYTVVAGIKNKEYYAIEPTITISILDGDRKFEQTHTLAAIEPDKMLPLKLQFPEVKGSAPILDKPIITYEETVNLYLGGYVIYETLVIHDDGSITGEIRNGGAVSYTHLTLPTSDLV